VDETSSHDSEPCSSDGLVPPEVADRASELALIGVRIKAARVGAGLTQQQLADLVSLNRVEISMIENGSRELGVLRLRRLCDALHVTSDSLLREG
jgi:DNA-binding XRE family transcriptional regulator